MVCYDDRYILRLASELDGVVVSNDNYRDLANESPAFRSVVQNNILMYSFVNDRYVLINNNDGASLDDRSLFDKHNKL